MSDDRTRSIVITLEPSDDIDAKVGAWLEGRNADVLFSVAEMANPARDAGRIEQVLAVDGLPERALAELLGELDLKPAVPLFRSFR